MTIERYEKVIRILENDVKTARSEYVKEFAKALIDKINGGVISDCSEVADFAADYLEQDIYNPMRCCDCKHYLPIHEQGLSGICCKTHISFGLADERIDEHVHYCALAERKEIDDT